LLLGLLCFTLACATVVEESDLFTEFMAKYNKVYASDERTKRAAIFSENLVLVNRMNKHEGSAIYGVTKFMDLSVAEFRNLYLLPEGSFKQRSTDTDAPYVNFGTENVAVPDAFDWRSKNAVTPTKNQGQCGSCWAFSATEAIESQWFLAGHPLISLAPQQIVDCDKVDQGCNGGDTPTAYQYVISAGGMESETEYPYTGVDGTCAFKSAEIKASIESWTYITKNKNETEMVQKLYALGPLSICVDAASWQFYVGGIVEHLCYQQLDHCVMITGYGNREDWLGRTVPVWNIRNSWGTDWGYDGYLYVERNEDLCGVADEVTIPLVK